MNQRTIIVPSTSHIKAFITDNALRGAVIAAAEQREGGVALLQETLLQLGLAVPIIGPVGENTYRHCPVDADHEDAC